MNIFRRCWLVCVGGLVTVLLSACSSSRAPLTAGEGFGSVPILVGSKVMVTPVQLVSGVSGDVEAEIVFALRERGQGVDWVLPEELRELARRNPELPVDPDGLAVGVFFQAEVERVGDPLFGELRRLNGLSRGTVAVIPLQVRPRGADEGIEILGTVLDARSGRVLWTGVVAGAPGSPTDTATLASAAQAFAQAVVR